MHTHARASFGRALAACVATMLVACDPPPPAVDAGVLGDAGPRGDAAVDAAIHDAAIDAALAPDGASDPDGGTDPCDGPAPTGPSRILFIGNSFTFTANLPNVFGALVDASGFPHADVEMRAVGGQTLGFHRNDNSAEGAVARLDEGDWDVVVLQEFSTRPTDSVGPAEQFKEDATWLYDRAVTASPDVRVVLYQTFARRAGHTLYPGTFDDPEDMQDQLRFHYDDCAERYLPMHATTASPHVDVARVGDAWELSLEDGEPPRLHGADDYHPNAAGAYLTALVFFGSVYHRSVEGLPAIAVSAEVATDLQAIADRVTGETEPAPGLACPAELAVGDRVLVDFGTIAASGWSTHASVAGRTGPLASEDGAPTGVVLTTRGFTGVQTGGSTTNDLGYPAGVSQDTLWVGSFDGHTAALDMSGDVVLSGLGAGDYTITLFASRDGDDGAAGRLTRFTVGATSHDLDVADNRGRTVTFDATPSAAGEISVLVSVSPEGAARFGYVGSLILERTR